LNKVNIRKALGDCSADAVVAPIGQYNLTGINALLAGQRFERFKDTIAILCAHKANQDRDARAREGQIKLSDNHGRNEYLPRCMVPRENQND
jgi:hypothetical protein